MNRIDDLIQRIGNRCDMADQFIDSVFVIGHGEVSDIIREWAGEQQACTMCNGTGEITRYEKDSGIVLGTSPCPGGCKPTTQPVEGTESEFRDLLTASQVDPDYVRERDSLTPTPVAGELREKVAQWFSREHAHDPDNPHGDPPRPCVECYKMADSLIAGCGLAPRDESKEG